MAPRGVYVPDEICEHCWCRVHSCVSGSPTHKRSGIADVGRDAASSGLFSGHTPPANKARCKVGTGTGRAHVRGQVERVVDLYYLE